MLCDVIRRRRRRRRRRRSSSSLGARAHDPCR